MPNPPATGQQSADDLRKAQAALDRAMVRWTAVVGVFTIALFLATATSAYFIWGQWHVAAKAQSRLLMESRAFFSVGQPVQDLSAVDKDGKPTDGFYGQWTNLGSTRANSAYGWMSLQYFPSDVPYNFDVSKPRIHLGPPTPLAVGPNAPVQTAEVGILHDEATQAESGKGILLIWGSLNYTDLFDPTRVRHGSFCYKLVPSGKATNSATKEVHVTFISVPFRPDCNTAE